MGAVIALDALLDQRLVWKGQQDSPPASVQPTGHGALDSLLPTRGWPESALTEILIAADGIGELQVLWPTLARLTAEKEWVVLIAPPYQPFAQAWQAAGVDLRQVVVIEARERDVLWAAEQCLRSGSCGAVLCWPQQADDRALRRLQVAAETGQTLAFAYRSLAEAVNPSPAALRLALDAQPRQIRVLKCRGGQPPAAPIALSAWG